MNSDTARAWEYHDSTKHSYRSVRTTAHYLDWGNQPAPFKSYPDLEAIPLPSDMPRSGVPALSAIVDRPITPATEPRLDTSRIASLLHYSAGVTKEKRYPQGAIQFRAAACAGALYPIEVYVVCGDIDGLAAGVYHFNPGDHALRCLRRGDYRGALLQATADRESIARAPVTFVYTAISWRSAWKYRARAYRYHYWDCGMILANAILLANAHGLSYEVVAGFVDEEVNRLLGIDGSRELALALFPVGFAQEPGPRPAAIASDRVPEIAPFVLPLSESEVEYPSIEEMHRASSLAAGQVEQWRRSEQPARNERESGAVSLSLGGAYSTETPRETLEDVIVRRASTRRFAKKPLPFGDLSIILDRAASGIRADFLHAADEQLNEIYAIVNRVSDVSSGSYYLNRRDRSLNTLKTGDFAGEAGHLVLDQELGGDASATLFFMVGLDGILARFGNRGYRVAQLESGILGGKVYIASYAMRRGATGLTFYDDDVTAFFSPRAKGMSCTMAMAVGIPGKRLVY